MRHVSSDMFHFNLMSPEDISDFVLSHHCNDLKFENLGESQLKTWSRPGFHVGVTRTSAFYDHMKYAF